MAKRLSSFLEKPIDLDEFDTDDFEQLAGDQKESRLSSLISELHSQQKKDAMLERLSVQQQPKEQQQQQRTEEDESSSPSTGEGMSQPTESTSESKKMVSLCSSCELHNAFDEQSDDKNKEWHQTLVGLLADKEIRIPVLPAISTLNKLKTHNPSVSEYLSDVVNYVKFCHSFPARKFTLPPILIVGEPGTGKTHFAKTMASILDLEHHVVPIAEAVDGFYLSGLQKGFNNAAPGRVTNRLSQGKSANPIIIFDELDKVTWFGDGTRKPLLPAMLQMLEPDTATEYRDVCLDVAIDYSHISFICTANTLDNIPAPILSRLTVIEMDRPKGEQMRKITESIFNRVSDELIDGGCGTNFFVMDECTSLLANTNPRDIHKIARQLVIKKIMDHGLENDIYIGLDDLSGLGVKEIKTDTPPTHSMIH